MLYFIHGEQKKVFDKAMSLIDSLLQKKSGAEVFTINTESFDADRFNELLHAQSLFSKKYVVYISHIIDDASVASVVLDHVSDMHTSEHVFVWTEGTISAKVLSVIEKKADKVQECVIPEKKKGREFNTFLLADAFGERDPKKLWILYISAIQHVAAEEIHGVLWWQLKSILLARCASSPELAGLKPFVYTKAKRFSKNFTEMELENLSDRLVSVYHDARRGGASLQMRLEEFILSI